MLCREPTAAWQTTSRPPANSSASGAARARMPRPSIGQSRPASHPPSSLAAALLTHQKPFPIFGHLDISSSAPSPSPVIGWPASYNTRVVLQVESAYTKYIFSQQPLLRPVIEYISAFPIPSSWASFYARSPYYVLVRRLQQPTSPGPESSLPRGRYTPSSIQISSGCPRLGPWHCPTSLSYWCPKVSVSYGEQQHLVSSRNLHTGVPRVRGVGFLSLKTAMTTRGITIK